MFLLTFEQVWRGEGMARQAEIQHPGSGSLDDTSCGPASVVPDCEKLRSHPVGKFQKYKNYPPHPKRNSHKIKLAWVSQVCSSDLL